MGKDQEDPESSKSEKEQAALEASRKGMLMYTSVQMILFQPTSALTANENI